MKYYFKDLDSELCYTLDYFIESSEPEETEIELYEAKIDYGVPYFFCSYHHEIGEVGQNCGKVCDQYIPRNGKNGRCKFSKNCYSPVNKVKIKL